MYLSYPFEEKNLISISIRNVTKVKELFPDKLKGSKGIQFRLTQILSPPNYFLKYGKLKGTNVYFLEIILARFNATYEFTVGNSTDLVQAFWQYESDLTLNRITPYNQNFFNKCDVMGTFESESFKLFVRTVHPDAVDLSSNNGPLLYIVIVLVTIVLYTIFLDFQRLNWMKNSLFFFQIMLLMPARINAKLSSRRILLTGFILYCMIETESLRTLLTSTMITYLPSTAIKSVDDIIAANIPIYGNVYSSAYLKNYRFNLPDAFLDRIEIFSSFPWSLNTTGDFAYVINESVFKRYVEIGIQYDKYDSQRFILINKHIVQYPLFMTFPKNSPFGHEIHRLYMLTEEAGLRVKWSSMILKELSDWTYFKPKMITRMRSESVVDLTFAIKNCFTGLLCSSAVFVMEIIANWLIRMCKRN